MFGYRIGDIVVKTFAKAVGERIAKRKLETGEEVTVGTVVDTIGEINKASLSAESVGAVVGDLIGGSQCGCRHCFACGGIAVSYSLTRYFFRRLFGQQAWHRNWPRHRSLDRQKSFEKRI